MSAVDFAIEYVQSGPTDISPYMLELAFHNPNNGYGSVWQPVNSEFSIDQGIREKVIMKMCAPLMNVAGGTTEVVDLSYARIENLTGGVIAVNVPDFLTGGRRIMQVIEVYPGNINRAIMNGNNFAGAATCGVGQMNNALSRLINGLDDGNVQRTFTNITMTGNNSFIIRDAGSALFNMIAKVVLSFDDHFTSLHPKSHDKFAEWVELGVKAYIYRNCRRGMQEAVARFGVTVDELQDEIQGYADSGKEFRDMYYSEMKKLLAYSDPKGKADTLKFLVPRKK